MSWSQDPDDTDAWLQAFHRGDRGAIERCYREHHDTVARAIGTRLRPADRETIAHEVFLKLLASEETRRSFRGGSLAAWITVIARHQAVDYLRRIGKETSLSEVPGSTGGSWEEQAQAQMLVRQFREERLPPEWWTTFECLFLQQLSQRDAAAALGVSRTTLAYRELRIRRALRRFLLSRAP